MALNIVPFALCLLFIYRCIYGFWTLYGKFTVELRTGCWILFHKILPQSYVVVAIHSLTVCTLYSLHTTSDFLADDNSGYKSAETKSTGDMFSIQETTKTARMPESLFPLPKGQIQEKPTRKPWTPKDIGKHTECINQQDNLWKMECELQGGTLALPSIRRITRR